MRSGVSVIGLGVAVLVVSGCAILTKPPSSRQPQAAYVSPLEVEKVLRENPLAVGQDIKSVEVYRTAEASYHLVQIAGQEKPHRHDHHDLIGYMVKGQGTLNHGGVPHPLSAGSVFYIPRGAVHFYRNESLEPSAVWISYAPAFDDQDTVPASAPEP